MHTSATPVAGNPNPAAGCILVKLQDSYNGYFGGFSGMVSPLGSNTATVAAHTSYVITALGTTTSAQWLAAGVPASALLVGPNGLPGLPTIGTAFIAIVSATIAGSPSVAPANTAGSGIDHIEVVGDPNQTVASQTAGGGYLLLQCFKNGVVTQPTDGTVLSLALYLSSTRILNKGE